MLQTNDVSGTAMSVALHADDDTLLTSNQTRARVGNVSHMCLWRWMRDERVLFPQPVQINRRNYWRLGDLRRWQATRTQKAAA
jgi:predicted DNA-binding transcriptional regulator AlpA